MLLVEKKVSRLPVAIVLLLLQHIPETRLVHTRAYPSIVLTSALYNADTQGGAHSQLTNQL